MNTAAEFTGERLIPGKVDVDLWNEHISRYMFAARHAHGRRVLDLGCGAGYGGAEFVGAGAASVTSLDVAADAIALARESSAEGRFVQASATQLPFKHGSFDLIAAFEVIEHIPDWPHLLSEAARTLAPAGILIVSTPSREFYAETRAESGPNPFHVHEFEYAEFETALAEHFPNVALFVQDHAEGIAFHSPSLSGTELRIRHAEADPNTSNFFVAVCSKAPLPALRDFLYVPAAANALREKLRHVQRLEGEIRRKDTWLAEQQQAHQELLAKHREQADELKARHEWALSVEAKFKEAGERIVALQEELEKQNREAAEVVAQYEAALARSNQELTERTEWAQQREAELMTLLTERTTQLQASSNELEQCVQALHHTEAELADRTRWAQELDAKLQALYTAVHASRWVKIGRAMGVGPELTDR